MSKYYQENKERLQKKKLFTKSYKNLSEDAKNKLVE